MMISLNDFTSFDVVVAVICIAFIVRGVWIGFLKQLAAFLALLGSYWLAGQYSGQIVPYVSQLIQSPRVVFFLTFIILFLVTSILFMLLGKALQKVMEISLLGWFDRLLGLLLGALKGFVMSSILYMALNVSLSAENDLLKKSVSSVYLHQGSEIVKQIINDPEIRQLFVPKEPAIKADS